MQKIFRNILVPLLWRLGRRYAVPLTLLALKALMARMRKGKKM